jgi:hypothetical protein
VLAVLAVLQLSANDTLRIRAAQHAPALEYIDIVHLRTPQVRVRTGQGTALVWLLRFRDTVFVAASIPDSSFYWGDDFVMSIDTEGNEGSSPQHDDFQLYFRRVVDSSVVYRGRNGRWQPPRDDPDWRLGAERSGGGWTVSAREQRSRWTLLVRMDPAWFRGGHGRPARVSFRVYDDSPGGWYAWPALDYPVQAKAVENSPSLWVPVR